MERAILLADTETLTAYDFGLGERESAEEPPSTLKEAARAAIHSPLLEDVSIVGARGVLVNITGGMDLALHDVHEATTIISEAAGDEANIIFGAVIDPRLDDEIRVTVIATGFGRRPTESLSDTKSDSMPLPVPRLREYCLSVGLFQCSWTPRLASRSTLLAWSGS